MTFSAPKSALAALVGKDERVIEAHIESLNEALKEVEKYLQAGVAATIQPSPPADDSGQFLQPSAP